MEILNEINKDKNQVIFSNSLIEAKYKLGVVEQKIIHRVLTQINVYDKELKFFRVHVSDFCDLLGKSNNYKVVISNACESLRKTDIHIETESGTEIKTTWFSSAEYFPNGMVELEISRKLSPYLLELKRNFTGYDFFNVINFKSQYSIRMYQLLKQYEKIGKRDIYLDELKEYFQVKNEYKKYANFKQKILRVAQKEINNLADITFEFKEIKKGRKVDKLKFYISANIERIEAKAEPAATTESQQDLDDLVDQLREIIKEPLKTKEYKALLQVAKNDLELIKSKYKLAKKAKNIDNLVGWLVKAIEEGFSEPVKKSKTNQFNDISSRDYDFDELERELQSKI